MTEQKTEMDAYYERSRRPLITMPQSTIGKFGCWLSVIVWFVVLLLPCAMFWLAMGNVITIPHATVPDPQENPLVRVRLIMDADNRGLQITRTGIQPIDDTNLCVDVAVTYLLWEAEDADQNVQYCQCYARSSTADNWTFSATRQQSCE